MMRQVSLLIMIAFGMISWVNIPNNQATTAAWMIEAIQAASLYLDALDRGQYSQSWSKTDPLFQRLITPQEWLRFLNQERKSLGKVKQRNIKLQSPKDNPHGLPSGPYMFLVYNTLFEKGNAKEIINLRKGEDGKWRVLTYKIE